MEGKEPTILELINKIELLKQVLLFYGNKKNYEGDSPIILKDSGFQADFALKKIKEIDDYNVMLIEESKKIIKEYDENDYESFYDKLDELQNLIKKSQE